MRRSTPLAALLLLPLLLAAAPIVLSWSTPFAGFWTWSGATNHAANLSEGGLTNWRLPQRAELQAALQSGSITGLAPNVGNGLIWTKDSKGSRAYAVQFATDAGGNVIPALSGNVLLIQKTSFVWAVALHL